MNTVFEYYGRDCLVYSFSLEGLHKAAFRVPERETQRITADIVMGRKYKFSQVIARAGYWIEPTDMPEELMKERARDLVLDFCRDQGEAIAPETLNVIVKACGDIFHQVNYTVRGTWTLNEAARARMDGVDTKMRTFFYLTLESEHTGIAKRKRYKMIGKQYNASYWGGGFDGPADYEPGGLLNAVRQEVWQVEDTFSNHSYLVHPSDLFPASETGG
jgi:hypothetical protein